MCDPRAPKPSNPEEIQGADDREPDRAARGFTEAEAHQQSLAVASSPGAEDDQCFVDSISYDLTSTGDE